MEQSGTELDILRARMAGLNVSLEGAWSEMLRAHLHLDRDTPECAYWHSGYHQALSDVLHMLAGKRPTFDSVDTSNPMRAAC